MNTNGLHGYERFARILTVCDRFHSEPGYVGICQAVGGARIQVATRSAPSSDACGFKVI